jgi:hypothetical protein
VLDRAVTQARGSGQTGRRAEHPRGDLRGAPLTLSTAKSRASQS